MLELKNICKVYETKDLRVDALKDINIQFRKNEFVSILGPSGCGKTTMLNIVGGLDKYTSGDLVINGRSTKEFTDRDWDSYRNHTIGFVFQSYNLIPHQTVLENVEIALTLSGISKEQRRQMAIDALKKVGLEDKIKSRPNQLSGGQMQRVAIARALVNDPDIVLADEPTGALDSKTSVQVMELLKEVAEERLVIMVTHNPELATEYSTRIIKLLDGELVDDSNPLSAEEVALLSSETVKAEEGKEEKTTQTAELVVAKPLKKRGRKKKRLEKTTMSYWTALMLSFKNLLTKKARTILVAFAGSIGIIGIALILSISAGFQTYVNKVQEDTLSSYPITINAQSVEVTDLITAMMMDSTAGTEEENKKTDAIYSNDSFTSLMTKFAEGLKANNLKKFYNYDQTNYSDIEDYITAIQYTYDLGLEFYDNKSDKTVNVQPKSSALYETIIEYVLLHIEKETKITITRPVTENDSYILTATDNTDLSYLYDFSMDQEKLNTAIQNQDPTGLFGADKVIYDLSVPNGSGEKKSSLSTSEITMLVYGVLKVNIQMFANYNLGLVNEMINNMDLVKEQYSLVGSASMWPTKANEVVLVLGEDSSLDDYILYALGLIEKDAMIESLRRTVNKLDPTMKVNFNDVVGKEYYVLTNSDYFVEVTDDQDPDYGQIVDIREKYVSQVTNPLTGQTQTVLNAQYYEEYNKIIEKLTQDQTSANERRVVITGVIRQKEGVENACLKSGIGYTSAFTNSMLEYNNESDAVTSGKAQKLEKNNPTSISIYANSFDSKTAIENFIAKYNEQAEEGDEIEYSNMIGMIMSGVSTIINAITYVLIAFVSVSLVVSSIMIGIITYISVLERIKEIGILRSVGASKKDIRRVFTAEAVIIGFVAGSLGIIVTWLLNIPINLILNALTGIGIKSALPLGSGTILVLISMFLTFIAGLIPAKIASKKDPVVALRTE